MPLSACRAAARAAAALLLLGSSTACARVHDDEARVLIARGSPVLLEGKKGRVLVALTPAASLVGLIDLKDLQPGDLVRYRWSEEVRGVRMAEALEVAPVVRAEPQFSVTESEIAARLAAAGPPTLLDARGAAAFARGHLPGARSLPADADDGALARVAPADPKAEVVVYGTGPRTGEAHALARRLLRAGHQAVKILAGGVDGWRAADRPLAVDAADVAKLLEGPVPWLVVDARAAARAAEETPRGAVSVPPEAFRWQDFDGGLPLPPVLFVGADAADRAPHDLADRVRLLRSARQVRTGVELHVLAGGFAAWKAAGLPVERGASRTAVGYRPVEALEISPEEFERLWAAGADAGAVLLDVRRVNTAPEEWVRKIPLEDLPARLGELPRDREVVAFCTIGQRSQVAAELLRANGFRVRFLRATPAR